jgi:hypothetical protein
MTDRLIELARRIQACPRNPAGADKTWVLDAMWQHRLFQQEVEAAERVDGA